MALVHFDRRFDGLVPARPARWVHAILRLCLYALPASWGLALEWAARTGAVPHARLAGHTPYLIVFSFAWIGALEYFHGGRWEKANREHTGATAVLMSVCAASGAASLLLVLLRLPLPQLTLAAVDAALLLPAAVGVELSFRAIFDPLPTRTRIAVVDASPCAFGVSWRLMRREVSRHEISGAVRLEVVNGSRWPTGALTIEELLREICREPVEGVLISAPLAGIAALSRRIQASGGLGAPVRFIVAEPHGSARLRDQLYDADCLYLLNTGAVPAGSFHYTVLKRAFDIAFAFAVLAIGWPLFVAIALIVKCSSHGGVFFVQERVGWNGQIFRMYKFRTMRFAASAESDTRWTEPGDPRLTAVGRILRRYSLDELPQFFNVLKGDMSVVGPRPERPYFVTAFRRELHEYHRRHQIKVGITGWAQVNGLRGDTCIRTRLMHDLYYLQNWGLVFDLKIVARTLLCIFSGKNAY